MTRSADELDPQLQEIEAIREERNAPESHAVTPETAREQLEAVTADASDRIDTDVAETNDFDIEGPGGPLPIRSYHPEGEGPHPIVVFYHGGGFVYGSIDTHDNVCRALCDAADALVLSVDYRLAPETPFPGAVHDAYAAVEWAAEFGGDLGGDTDRLAVMGDSAGGNLAAVVSLLARERDGPDIDRQVLVYPWMDPAARFDYDSYEENRDPDEPGAGWLTGKYARDELDHGNHYFAPILAQDLEGLPPATIVTAGFDALRDEGIDYDERLQNAGVETTIENYPAMNHGFVNLLGLVDRAEDAVDLVAADLAVSFGE